MVYDAALDEEVGCHRGLESDLCLCGRLTQCGEGGGELSVALDAEWRPGGQAASEAVGGLGDGWAGDVASSANDHWWAPLARGRLVWWAALPRAFGLPEGGKGAAGGAPGGGGKWAPPSPPGKERGGGGGGG